VSFLFADRQTTQLQAIIGTPLLVPVPKKVIFNLLANTVVKIVNAK